MLDAAEALLFCSGYHLAIPNQDGSGIGMEGVEAENQSHGEVGMGAIKVLKLSSS